MWRASVQMLFWFIWRHSDNSMGRTSDLHRGDFLGLETSIRRLIFYFVQSGSVCNSPVFSDNTIYMGISIIQLLCALCICIRYLLSVVADDTVDVWDGGRALSFEQRKVYMSILTLWYSNWEFCTHFDYIFWLCVHERPNEYRICIHTYHIIYIYI